MSTVTAYIGLGSNLADPVTQLDRALAALATVPGSRLAASSRYYCNPPMGPQDQPDYVNAVAALETGLAPLELLAELQRIERAQGRRREATPRWGPRTLDLDLLLYGDQRLSLPGLEVPHPGLAERAFVLVPLAEIAPAVVVPGQPPLAVLVAALGTVALEPVLPAAALS